MSETEDTIARLNAALQSCADNVVALQEREKLLTDTLLRGLTLMDTMMTELHQLKRAPTMTVIVAKQHFDKAMKELLGSDVVNRSRGTKS